MTVVLLVALIFSFQLAFESLNILARVSGSIIKSNAVGASLDKILSTLKRFFIFAYAPILGYLVYLGDVARVFFSIFTSIALGSFCVSLIIIFRRRIIGYFIGVVLNMNKGVSLIEAFCAPEKINIKDYKELLPQKKSWLMRAKIDFRMFLPLILIYLVYSSAVFIVNVLAVAYTSAAPIILQMLGFINGLATLVLAFLIEPSLARTLEKREDLSGVSEHFLMAQLLSVMLISPLLFLVMYISFF